MLTQVDYLKLDGCNNHPPDDYAHGYPKMGHVSLPPAPPPRASSHFPAPVGIVSFVPLTPRARDRRSKSWTHALRRRRTPTTIIKTRARVEKSLHTSCIEKKSKTQKQNKKSGIGCVPSAQIRTETRGTSRSRSTRQLETGQVPLTDHTRTYRRTMFAQPPKPQALQNSSRDIVYSCSWPAYLGSNESTKPFGAMVAAGCNLWRNWHDIQGNWRSVSAIIDHWGDYGPVLQVGAH
jgi:hypothetical protein